MRDGLGATSGSNCSSRPAPTPSSSPSSGVRVVGCSLALRPRPAGSPTGGNVVLRFIGFRPGKVTFGNGSDREECSGVRTPRGEPSELRLVEVGPETNMTLRVREGGGVSQTPIPPVEPHDWQCGLAVRATVWEHRSASGERWRARQDRTIDCAVNADRPCARPPPPGINPELPMADDASLQPHTVSIHGRGLATLARIDEQLHAPRIVRF